MGARNVAAVFTGWGHLDHAPFRLLSGMALQSLDQASDSGRPPRVWFGGEDALVELVGRSRTQAYRALTKLKEAGVVEVLDAGRTSHRAVYKLHLDAAEIPTVSRSAGPNSVPLSGTYSVPLSGTYRVPLSGTPRNHEGTTKESLEGETSPQVTTSPVAVDNFAQASKSLIARHGPNVHSVVRDYRDRHACDARTAVLALAQEAPA